MCDAITTAPVYVIVNNMDNQYITSVHISKLGHNLLEVRERALKNILSKIRIGIPFDNAFARQKEILFKCFDLFGSENCSMKGDILELITYILKSDVGLSLINHISCKSIIDKMRKLGLQVNDDHFPRIDEIIKYLERAEVDNKAKVLVPPLVSEVPLSYRSDCENVQVESTASPIDGFIYHRSEDEQQSGLKKNSSKRWNLFNCDSLEKDSYRTNLKYFSFNWQPLIKTDRHILDSVETSLKCREETELLHTCYFFMDILIRDFPVEVFLQRSNILKELENIFMSSSSSQITLIVAKCFFKFSKELLCRINSCSDPAVYSLKQYKYSSFPQNNLYTSYNDYNKEDYDEVANVKLEISVPRYCLESLHLCLQQFLSIDRLESPGIDSEQLHLYVILLQLIDNYAGILSYSFKYYLNCLWKAMEFNSINDDYLSRLINSTLIKFSNVIYHISFSIKCMSDFTQSLYLIYINLIVTYLKLLKLFLPLNVIEKLIKSSFYEPVRKVLVTIASDVILMLFYPEIYKDILEYVKIIDNKDVEVCKCLNLRNIYDSVASAVKILKSSLNGFPSKNDFNVEDVKKSFESLYFYKDTRIIDIFMDLCVENNKSLLKDDDINEILCNLLAHKDSEIKTKVYCMIKKKLTNALGPTKSSYLIKENNIDFLLNGDVFNQIILSGLSSHNAEIRQHAEQIFLIILKCSVIASENAWRKIIELMLLTFPALSCFANLTSPLGQTIIDIIDPDRAQSIGITLDAVFKGNLVFLFNPHPAVRNEAVSRLCWLLSIQSDQKNLLPRTNYFSNKSLHNICFTKYQVDVNRLQETPQTYHQPGTLEKLLKLLNEDNLDPLIRRSTLTQLSVLMEDQILHKIFLELEGVGKIVAILKDALTEKNYEIYPDCAISALSILKSLALYNSSVRQTLGRENEILYYVFRAMLLYRTDDRLINDGSTLIFAILFNNLLKGTPLQSNLSLPSTIKSSLQIPFTCAEFNNSAKDYANYVCLEEGDKEHYFYFKIMWNMAWFQGEREIFDWRKPKKDDHFNPSLYLTESELLRVQSASLEYSLKECFRCLQNDASDDGIDIDAVVKLIGYAHLYRITSNYSPQIDLLSLPWFKTFEKFFHMEPINEYDARVVLYVLECLELVVPLYKSECWLCDLVMESRLIHWKSGCLEEESKLLKQELFRLITTCVRFNENVGNVLNVVEIISECLSCDVQGFYNLALLDSMLTCLTCITSSSGWSQLNNSYLKSNKNILRLTCNLCELIGTFHCGKGENASDSVMGSTIIKNAILSLNHMLAEMHYCEMDNFDEYFTEEGSGIVRNLLNIFLLFASRDTIVRAGVFQLFTGLFLSSKCINELTNDLKEKNCDLQELLVSVLIDEYESSLVKENAANALSNYAITLCKSKNDDSLNNLPKVLNKVNFYHSLVTTFDCIYFESELFISNEDCMIYFKDFKSKCDGSLVSKSSESNSSLNKIQTIVTVGCATSFVRLLSNVFQVLPSSTIIFLNQHHVIKRLLRLLTKPNQQKLNTTRDVELYSNIMEMKVVICNFLSQLLDKNHQFMTETNLLQDIISSSISLLKPNIYFIELRELLRLRNRLWSESLRLLANLLYFQRKTSQIRTLDDFHQNIINLNYLQVLCVSLSVNFKEERDLIEFALRNIIYLANFQDDSLIQLNENNSFGNSFGKQLSKLLLELLEMTTINTEENKEDALIDTLNELVLNALIGFVGVSREAKEYILENGGVLLAIKQLKKLELKLSLEEVGSLKRNAKKKQIVALLMKFSFYLQFLNNLSTDYEQVKLVLIKLNFFNLIYKHWNWISATSNLLIDALKILCTLTYNCLPACSSLSTQNSFVAQRTRKTSGSNTFIGAIVTIILREMDFVSKTHDLEILKCCFQVLQNSCCSVDCRLLIIKSNLLGCWSKLHPSISRHQKSWEQVQILWLEFLTAFTVHPEGQTVILKIPELLPTFITIASNGNTAECKMLALVILRNVSFCSSNKPRLLACSEYLQLLSDLLLSGNKDERLISTSILWSLSANNQKAKVILKCAGLDGKLRGVLQTAQVCVKQGTWDESEVEEIRYVLQILRDNDF